jgi:nucleotide-binding universal stress UspA family protein
MSMFSSLVVGTDGSETAGEAVRGATQLAKLLSATLHIVTVYRPKAVRGAGVPDEYLDALGPGGTADALLDDQCARVAEQVHADLIVVGNKGMAGVRRVLGSVPNSVAHQAPCSVLILQTT